MNYILLLLSYAIFNTVEWNFLYVIVKYAKKAHLCTCAIVRRAKCLTIPFES